MVKRTSIVLPDDLAWRVHREAAQTGASVAEVIRRAVAARYQGEEGDARSVPFASLGRSGFSDTAERLEEILAEDWATEHDRDR